MTSMPPRIRRADPNRRNEQPTRTIPRPILDRCRSAFRRMIEIEGHDAKDADWVALIEQREAADPLADDAFLRGYLVGIAEAFGMSISDLLRALQASSASRPRRRIVEVGTRRTG